MVADAPCRPSRHGGLGRAQVGLGASGVGYHSADVD